VKLSPETGITENTLPEESKIGVFPNPFNSSVTITVPEGSKLEIFDNNGKKVRVFDEEDSTNIVWDGTDNSKKPLPNGIYFIKDKTSGKQTEVVLMK
jgi:flagellar hook assembly protein FlgD